MVPLILCVPRALANGQTSHVHITLDAREHLPPGALRDLVLRDDLKDMLVNGAMFPDGGYAMDHPYGENAHWEWFQSPYRQWIDDSFDEPYDDEAARHLAFLLGMASHGMADQVYDALFMERAREYDASSDWGRSMDEATDVAFAAGAGAITAPPAWVPTDDLIPLFLDPNGIVVDEDTLLDGQGRLAIAIAFVGAAAGLPDRVSAYQSWYPWATTHQSVGIPGAPADEAVVVARYWEALWARLHGDDLLDDPVLATWPADGAGGHPTEAARVASRVTVAFSRGLASATVGPEDFVVRDAAGAEQAVAVDVFYGEASHLVHLIPLADWAPDETYTVEVRPGVQTWDGASYTAGATFTFSTSPAPGPAGERPVVGPAPPGTRSSALTGGCGCAGGSPAAPGLLGVAGLAAARRRRGVS